MKYYIKTFGCQMNVSDSDKIAGILERRGYKKVLDEKSANLIVINVCSVRQSAVDRVYAIVNRNSGKKIILCGCVLESDRKKLKGKVSEFWKTSKYFNTPPCHKAGATAYVPIMTGCNNFCSYCVVPFARGREVSRPANEIIREIKSLIKKGYKEIVLLGQNVNSYKDGKINFSKLIKQINSIPGNFWISFISNHPKDVTDEMIETVAKCKKVCECFHLPIQAGNDEIIKHMNRKYMAKEYLALVKKIKGAYKKYKPGALYSITSDIIVGFPEETRKQFLDSAEVMKKVKYDMVYFGQFSPRPGTAAWNMKDNVFKKEKGRREKYLNEILKKTTFENNKKYIGTIQEILVDRRAVNHSRELLTEKEEDVFEYFGRTRTMKNVKFESNKKNLVGKFVKVKITKANTWNLEGICR